MTAGVYKITDGDTREFHIGGGINTESIRCC